MFRESQNRVRSMALIHEKLYQSMDLARIDFAGYVRELADYLFRMYGANSHNIKLEVNVEDVPLDIDTAIPCGLIINELVSNSLKYGFPADVEKESIQQSEFRGEIRVGLCAGNDGELILTVSDNGIGFPENLDFQNTESLGLQLVNTLTGQLEGDIQLDRKAGTTFNITFAGPKSKRRG
jgi:two-component sensor histidine kinase